MKMTHRKLLGLLACGTLALSAQIAFSADYQTTVLSQGPVGYWRLNETDQPPTPPINATNSGTVGSPAGDGNYFEAIRGVTPGVIVSQPANRAVKFVDPTDIVGTPANRVWIANNQAPWNTGGPFTVEFWIKPDRTNLTQCVAANVEFIATPAAQRNGWLIYQGNAPNLTDGQGFSFRLYNSTGLTAVSQANWLGQLDPNSFYHVVGTFDGTNIKLYLNGTNVATTAIAGTFRYNTNAAVPMTFGARGNGASGSFTSIATFDEAAYYGTALSAAQVLAHYQAGTNASPVTPYQQVISADSPAGYWRFNEPPDVTAINIGTFGSAANGTYGAGTVPGSDGPRPTIYSGFGATNTSVLVDGTGTSVSVPALNLNTNTVTISGWVKVSTDSETPAAGLVVCHSGTTYSGLTMDGINGGLGIGYVWNNDPNTYNWSPTTDLGFQTLPSSVDNQWAYVALVIQPAQAAIYLCQSNNAASFAGVTNFVNHVVQKFEGATLFGSDTSPGTPFAGNIDEVAIFNRALGVGELYTQYGAAVGGVGPKIFTDLQGPTNSVYAGDPITLSIDAGGTPSLTFTWHRNGSTIATTSVGTYTIGTSTFGDAGNYDVTISNGIGTPAQSQQVPVTIITPTTPTINGSTGFVNRRLYTGGTISLAVNASGGGLKYQWYKNASVISGATASSFRIASVAAGDAGSYSVSITNSLGTASNGPAVVTIPSVPTGGFEAAVLASGPEAWWRLDEAPGSTNLWDGMGRHDGYYTNLNGAVPPVALGAAGIGTNTAASFSNNGGVGVIPYALSLNSADKHTYEGWIKTSDLSRFMVPYSSDFNGGGVYWAETPNGFWNPATDGGAYPIASPVAIASGVWTHLVMTFDNSLVNSSGTHFPLSFFINGVNISGAGFSWTDNNGLNTNGPVIIGGRGVNATTLANAFFSGLVDDVIVYTKALSTTEIANHFALGFPSTPPTFAGAFIPQTVTTGKTVGFSTTVQGSTPLFLQWYKNGALIPGATTNSLTITNTAVSDTGTYALWATNSVGTNSQSVGLTVIAATGFANVTNNLVLHLRFDGDDTDSSGRGHNGTPVGSPAFVTGVIGSQALQYTTTSATNAVTNIVETGSSYVRIGTPTDLLFGSSSSFSVAVWVKVATNNLQGDLPFIGTATNSNNNPGWDLSPSYGGGGYQWNLNDSTNNVNVNGPANSINDGGWHHFVMAVDRASHIVNTYLDGVLYVQTDITPLGNLDVGGPVTIGQDPTGSYPFAITNASATDFAGWVPSASATLDDVGIWRRALSPLEVAQIESAGRTAGHSFDTVASAVTLTISRSGSNITISWPSGTLYQSDTVGVGAVWTPVAGASAPSYTFTPGSGSRYYRVQ